MYAYVYIYLQQLHEEALLADGDELLDLLGLALGELHAVHPTRHQHAARSVLVEHLGKEIHILLG